MKDLIAGIKYDASKVISRAIGPSKEFCMGYMNPGMPDGGGIYIDYETFRWNGRYQRT